MEVISNFFKKEPNLSFVTAKIQQNCTDTGNDNSEATRQRINCDSKEFAGNQGKHQKGLPTAWGILADFWVPNHS